MGFAPSHTAHEWHSQMVSLPQASVPVRQALEQWFSTTSLAQALPVKSDPVGVRTGVLIV